MNKAHSLKNWENHPSINTPLNAQNLNELDGSVDMIDDRVITLDTTKFNKTEAQGLFKDVSLNQATGVITFTMVSGATKTIDTLLEKIAINFDYDETTQRLIITLEDGTVKYIDLSALITQYEFLDSDTIAFSLSSNGKVNAIVKEGSIQEKHLQPNYLADIKVEVAKAQSSQQAAATSEANAKASENAAKESQTAAKKSEDNAAASATNSENSATIAGQKAAEAANSANAAKTSETNAESSKNAAKASETSAENSKASAAASATRASGSASTATAKAEESKNYAGMSQSYAVGTDGNVRENDNTDCAKYYYEQTKKISQSYNGVVPMGSIAFDDLSNPDNQQSGYMFNISDSFVSDERFNDGGGIFYGAGNNVLYTADGKWDVLAATMVSGVKGNKETEYRQGFVNLTPDNIGAFPGVVSVTTENTNLNDYTESGIYFFALSYAPVNAPIDGGGWLTVIRTDTNNVKHSWLQRGTTNNSYYSSYVREKGSSGWSDWTRFITERDVATTTSAGIVKPDGKTIKVDADGAIVGAASGFTGTKAEVEQAIGSGEISEDMIVNITDDYDDAKIVYDAELSETSENAVQNKAITAVINKINSNFAVLKRESMAPYGYFGIEWELDELMSFVRAGEWDKFAHGDYFIETTTTGEQILWEVAGKNSYLHCGDTPLEKPHIVCCPRDCFETYYKYNSSNTNVGGYAASLMPANLETEANKFTTKLQGYMTTIRRLENNKGTWAYASRRIFPPGIVELTGTNGFADGNSGGAFNQLPLFAGGNAHLLKGAGFNKKKAARTWYWAADPSAANSMSFCDFNGDGSSTTGQAYMNGAIAPLIVLS